MGENIEPRIELHVHFDSDEKFIEGIKALGRLASQPLTVEAYVNDEQLGLFEIDYRMDSGREILTKQSFQTHYFERFGPKVASNFPGRVFTNTAVAVGEEGLVKDKNGDVVAIKRSAFNEFFNRLNQRGLEPIAGFGPRTQSRKFILGLHAALPEAIEQ